MDVVFWALGLEVLSALGLERQSFWTLGCWALGMQESTMYFNATYQVGGYLVDIDFTASTYLSLTRLHIKYCTM